MSARRRQGGFSLVAALFLLVVLSGLAVFIVRVSAAQAQTTTLALLGARAFHAARSGIDWGVYQAVNNSSCGVTTLNLAEGGLAGFVVDVSCTNTTHTEGADSFDVYVVDAFAQAGNYGMPDYVSRRIRATVATAP